LELKGLTRVRAVVRVRAFLEENMFRPDRLAFACLLVTALAAGCVTTSAHERALAELQQKHQQELDQRGAERAALEKKLADTEAARKDLEAKLAAATLQADELKKVLEGNTTERDQLNNLLAASGAQLAELNRQKAAADARAATYRSLTERLR
jgi:septal ring factor EnvC (AmiA/AmiB activator)